MHTQVFSSSQRIEGDLRDQGFLPPLPASVPDAPAQPSPPAAASPSAASTTNSEGGSSPPVSAPEHVLRPPTAPPASSNATEDVMQARPWIPLLMVRHQFPAVRFEPSPSSSPIGLSGTLCVHAESCQPVCDRRTWGHCCAVESLLNRTRHCCILSACTFRLALTAKNLQTLLQGLL